GCGGTGSNLAMLLAACGFKKFQFIDFDVVALNNFNRQHLFSLADLGRPKVDALKDRIIERFSQVSIETKRLRIDSIDDLKRCRSIKSKSQLFILCADTPTHLIRKWTTQFCFSNSIPLFFGAVGLYESSVGPLLQSKDHFKNYLK
ncbi:MAG: ThiF family adenylyltransferase, partial [Bdellovibrionota bacterium]